VQDCRASSPLVVAFSPGGDGVEKRAEFASRTLLLLTATIFHKGWRKIMTLEARTPSKARTGIAALNFAAAAACAAVSLGLAPDCALASTYLQTNLTSDIPGVAANPDPNLKNPWGMAFSATSPFWLSDQAINVATLYNSAGNPQALVVSTTPGPTGNVFNGTPSFNSDVFLFATLSGQIAGWRGALGTQTETTFIANDGAVYTGLAIANIPNTGIIFIRRRFS
jgi:hypothetical protein